MAYVDEDASYALSPAAAWIQPFNPSLMEEKQVLHRTFSSPLAPSAGGGRYHRSVPAVSADHATAHPGPMHPGLLGVTRGPRRRDAAELTAIAVQGINKGLANKHKQQLPPLSPESPAHCLTSSTPKVKFSSAVAVADLVETSAMSAPAAMAHRDHVMDAPSSTSPPPWPAGAVAQPRGILPATRRSGDLVVDAEIEDHQIPSACAEDEAAETTLPPPAAADTAGYMSPPC
eukprot:jgi/Chrzof1/5122/Cz15g12080.t1